MSKPLKQVAALPVMETAGTPHVLLLTSRGSQSWTIPKEPLNKSSSTRLRTDL
jgi:hypothetical protein